MRVLVTGSRDWYDEEHLRGALEMVYKHWLETERGTTFVVVQGGARGADTMAQRWAQEAHRIDARVLCELHSADWEQYGKAAGHIRNRVMVERGADYCLAFPLGESRGTRGCMKLAEQAQIPTFNLGGFE
jgi:SLOG family YspA-like protein